MEEDLLEILYPTITEAVRRVDAGEIVDLDRLPWADIAEEMCIYYVYRDGEWQIDDEPVYALPTAAEVEEQSYPQTHSSEPEEEPTLSGLQVYFTTSDNIATSIRLIQAASLHVDTLVEATSPAYQADYRRFLTGALVYAMAWMCRREADEQLQTVILPAVRRQEQENALNDIYAYMHERQAQQAQQVQQAPIVSNLWRESTMPKWSRITQKAYEQNKADEIMSSLRRLCTTSTVNQLCIQLNTWYRAGFLDLKGAKKKIIYDELTTLFGKLQYGLDNFRRYYKPRLLEL